MSKPAISSAVAVALLAPLVVVLAIFVGALIAPLMGALVGAIFAFVFPATAHAVLVYFGVAGTMAFWQLTAFVALIGAFFRSTTKVSNG